MLDFIKRGDILLHQKLLSGARPYFVALGNLHKFQRHRHPEMEFIYCVEGEFQLAINGLEYNIQKGDCAIIASMAVHEILKNSDKNSKGLVIEIGPVLLEHYFEALAKVVPINPILRISKENNEKLYCVLKELIFLFNNRTEFSELLIKGNLYKFGAYILEECEKNDLSEEAITKFRTVANIEKAYECIYENYNRRILIDEVALLCGYSKSNFCKIFKSITGETFHGVLNNYRVQRVCDMLTRTDYSVEDIAVLTGFSDTKSLCRTFKKIMGKTTGEYRKNIL